MITRVSFIAGERGDWTIASSTAIAGTPLPYATQLSRYEGDEFARGGTWSLDGVRSSDRYVTRAEKDALLAGSPPLGRLDSRRAALIPIRKSDAWWALPQDERRHIFEESSRHIAIGRDYTPAIARRLYHCRELGQPFDFLTWFEYAAVDANAFDDLVGKLRATEEWRYVDREVDVRVLRV